jgi:hypothetical protein
MFIVHEHDQDGLLFAPQSNTLPLSLRRLLLLLPLRYHDSSRLAGIQRIMVTSWGWEDPSEKGLGLLTSLGDIQKARRCLREIGFGFLLFL